ncbi:TetR/AcrR family transcriptional regulator [Nocardia transvalensis]|uniref:TetR/AcrR family transcriptional regulator n=1 Tax=Nocardia transvalensis TaxID=37333 RepID=UPI001895C57A|nr:TetR/AcrR family transcriptional regulator [Nocardia transvalensis]MBF6332179.1 TetR/AcrR family transcriptional regulator [Nocardia transvalensis]
MNSRSRPARSTGATTRDQLIEAGIRLLEEDGPEALQTRRVAAAVGVSTMAVYTHFGGMTGLLEAIATEAFARFGAALARVAPTADPVADLFVMGTAYHRYALANPQRYRLMFGLTAPHVFGMPAPQAGRGIVRDLTAGPADDAIGAETFEQLVRVTERIIEGGHIRTDPVRRVAARLWGMIHGVVLLELSGHLGGENRALVDVLAPLTVDVLVGMGADRGDVEASLGRAIRTITSAR